MGPKETEKIKIPDKRTITVRGITYPSRMKCPSCGDDALYLGGVCDRCNTCGWSNGSCSG